MTSKAAQDLAHQVSEASRTAARAGADLAITQHADVLKVLDRVEAEQQRQTIAQAEMRGDLRRVEALATEAVVQVKEAVAQAKVTNGKVGSLELWRAEMKGIAQGAGGTGRMLFYMLSAGGVAASVLWSLAALSGHLPK